MLANLIVAAMLVSDVIPPARGRLELRSAGLAFERPPTCSKPETEVSRASLSPVNIKPSTFTHNLFAFLTSYYTDLKQS